MSASLAGVALVTWIGYGLLALNATTVGFGYLLLVLAIATVWGLVEASVASVAATLAFNFYFFPPVGTFTIADPQNWVALFSFLATALVASRLSARARHRALDAIARRQDVERLYTFSRALLLIGKAEPFAKQLAIKLAEIFELSAVVVYDRRSDEFHPAGASDFEGLDDQLKEAALQGTSFTDTQHSRTITAVRLGSEPIAALGLQGAPLPDGVLQSIGNLVAIGLERAHAQELAAQVEIARQSERLRTALLDAMAHEFKTPLTSVIAATSALLDKPEQPLHSRLELLQVADEEAHRLQELIEDTVEMGRLDNTAITVEAEQADLEELARDVLDSMRSNIDNRPVETVFEEHPPAIKVDRRLVKLAIKQLLDNAFKYSPSGTPVTMKIYDGDGMITLAVTDRGPGIPNQEQSRIFDRLYRMPSVRGRIPGSGLGLSIALNIARAHHGDLTVSSRPGETTFQLRLPTGASE